MSKTYRVIALPDDCNLYNFRCVETARRLVDCVEDAVVVDASTEVRYFNGSVDGSHNLDELVQRVRERAGQPPRNPTPAPAVGAPPSIFIVWSNTDASEDGNSDANNPSVEFLSTSANEAFAAFEECCSRPLPHGIVNHDVWCYDNSTGSGTGQLLVSGVGTGRTYISGNLYNTWRAKQQRPAVASASSNAEAPPPPPTPSETQPSYSYVVWANFSEDEKLAGEVDFVTTDLDAAFSRFEAACREPKDAWITEYEVGRYANGAHPREYQSLARGYGADPHYQSIAYVNWRNARQPKPFSIQILAFGPGCATPYWQTLPEERYCDRAAAQEALFRIGQMTPDQIERQYGMKVDDSTVMLVLHEEGKGCLSSLNIAHA